MSERRWQIYTDGGAKPNPGPGGWGVVILPPGGGPAEELSGAEPRTTNNRMELTAAIRALEAIGPDRPVAIHTDSLYLKKGVTQWLRGWKARGWQRRGGEVQNIELWRRLDDLVTEHDVAWRWVRGHAGHRWNERADQLATEARRRLRAGRPAAARKPAASRGHGPPEVFIYLRVSRRGSRGAWAAGVRREGREEILSGCERGASPNRLDLLAVLRALEPLPEETVVAVHTPSDYLRKGASEWLAGWQRRGWKTASGGAVQNADLWRRLASVLARRRVVWEEVDEADPGPFEDLAPVLERELGG